MDMLWYRLHTMNLVSYLCVWKWTGCICHNDICMRMGHTGIPIWNESIWKILPHRTVATFQDGWSIDCKNYIHLVIALHLTVSMRDFPYSGQWHQRAFSRKEYSPYPFLSFPSLSSLPYPNSCSIFYQTMRLIRFSLKQLKFSIRHCSKCNKPPRLPHEN